MAEATGHACAYSSRSIRSWHCRTRLSKLMLISRSPQIGVIGTVQQPTPRLRVVLVPKVNAVLDRPLHLDNVGNGRVVSPLLLGLSLVLVRIQISLFVLLQDRRHVLLIFDYHLIIVRVVME